MSESKSESASPSASPSAGYSPALIRIGYANRVDSGKIERESMGKIGRISIGEVVGFGRIGKVYKKR
jgi:hypothetical protein